MAAKYRTDIHWTTCARQSWLQNCRSLL